MTFDPEERVRQLLAGAAARITSSPPDPAHLHDAEPATRASRRWIPAVAAVVAVAAIIGGVAWSTQRGSHQSHAVSAIATTSSTASSTASSAAPSALPSAEGPVTSQSAPPVGPTGSGVGDDGPVTLCSSADLKAAVISRGEQAQQPYLVVGLTNRGITACQLSGYPTLAMYSASPPGPGNALRITVRPGVHEQPVLGPQLPDSDSGFVIVRPGAIASFYIATDMASPGGADPIDIRAITVTVRGDSQPISVPLSVDAPLTAAAAAPGQSLTVGVSAYSLFLAGGERTLAAH
jgi:Protein of unknown function (DUF4232)